MIHKFIIKAPKPMLTKLSFLLSRHLYQRGHKFSIFNDYHEHGCISIFPKREISLYEVEAAMAEVIGLEALEYCKVKAIEKCQEEFQLLLDL